MNFGHSIFAIAALVVITFLVISANRIVNQSFDDELKGEAYNQAGEIASDLINEAMTKKFDDPSVTHTAVVNQWVYNPSTRLNQWIGTVSYKLYNIIEKNPHNFTSPGSLGPSTSVPLPDRYPYKSIGYDDFDDYNGYQRIVDTPLMTGFVVNCTVSYVDTTNLNTPVYYQTYYKRLVVKVMQPTYLADTLFFSTIMTY